jgi:hypothetical protein
LIAVPGVGRMPVRLLRIAFIADTAHRAATHHTAVKRDGSFLVRVVARLLVRSIVFYSVLFFY